MTITNYTKGSSTMQNMNHFHQQNKYYVNPVWYLQWGLLADGKILHCENMDFL